MTKHDEPANVGAATSRISGEANEEAVPAEGESMNAFEYAVLRHVRDLKEESKKRKLNPAEERFLRIVQDLSRQAQLKAS